MTLAVISAVALAVIVGAATASAQEASLASIRALAVERALDDMNAEILEDRARDGIDSNVNRPPPRRAEHLGVTLLDSFRLHDEIIYLFSADLPRFGRGERTIVVTSKLHVYPLFGFRTNNIEGLVDRYWDDTDSIFLKLAKVTVTAENAFRAYYGYEFVQPLCDCCELAGIDSKVASYPFSKTVVLWSAKRGVIRPELVHRVDRDPSGFRISTIRLRQ